MRAIGLTSYGGPEVLQQVNLPDPHPASGQVRVKVRAAGINPVDEMVRAGNFAALFGQTPPPFVPGMDIAGTIDEIGDDIDPAFGVRLGQDVVGIVNNFGSYGGYSEYVCLPAASVIPMPTGATFPEAASFLMNALTARNALDNLKLPKGSTVLVTGAAGAVGAYTVALAHDEGLRVVAVASPEDEAFLRTQGASVFVQRSDELAQRVREQVPKGVDAVVDTARLLTQITPAVRDEGIVIVLRPVEEDKALERGISTKFVNVRDRATDHAAIMRIVPQVSSGLLPMRVAAVFPASEAVAAHRRLAEGHLRGRIVLDFDQAGI
jgi:NADPH:quinone reductase-like Zn-dependent oxidoreductase